jgi:hypothetical protein
MYFIVHYYITTVQLPPSLKHLKLSDRMSRPVQRFTINALDGIYHLFGALGSLVVKALGYRPEGLKFT